jgi:hypothetical protein
MTGLAGEIIASEIILSSSSLRRDNGDYNYFLLGFLAQTIVNPIIYTIYSNNVKKAGDFSAMRWAHHDDSVVSISS